MCMRGHWLKHKDENTNVVAAWGAKGSIYMRGLTFAGLGALKPPVIGVSVAGASAVFIPSTPRSTTADSTGFLERVTLWAHYLIGRGDSSCGCADWCGDCHADYF